MPSNYKPYLSPLVAIAFVIISVTGVLLLFEVKNGPLMVLHEWFGLLFVLAGAVHALVNWRPLAGYCRQPRALLSLGLAFVLAIGMIIAGLQHRGGHHRHHSGDEPSEMGETE